jgi:hypothetical protein
MYNLYSILTTHKHVVIFVRRLHRVSSALLLSGCRFEHYLPVGVSGPTAHPGLPLKVFLGVGRCQRL